MILVIANIGLERIAPGIPHIQNQKTSEMMTRTGLRVNRLARSLGVTVSPSIVFMAGSDPVRRGFVTSLNRPGGNLTGVTLLAGDLNGKRFGLLHDMVPEAAVIGVLFDPKKAQREFGEQEVQAAARNLGVTILMIEAGTESEIEAAFATFAREDVRAVFVINSYFFYIVSDRLDELALQHRMALSGELRKFISGGALMSYGPDLEEAWRQVGVYTARILKGEKPADLPVQQPTKYELVINLRTAKTLGLTIPQSVVLLADEVIE